MNKLLFLSLSICFFFSCDKDSSELLDSDPTISTHLQEDLDLRSIPIAGRVWNDVDADGIQDASEKSIDNALVHFIHAKGGWTIATQTTSESGQYSFNPGKAIDYYLKIELPLSLNNYVGSPKVDIFNNTLDGLDSDLENENGKFTSATYNSGEPRKLDFGFYEGGQIGGRVWSDAQLAGISHVFDSMDEPVAGVIVRLIEVNMSFSSRVVDSTLTDANGNYLFEKLKSAIYQVEFEITNPQQHLTFVTPNISGNSNDDRDSDVVQFIYQNNLNLVGQTGMFTLEASEKNMNIDCGLGIGIVCIFPNGGGTFQSKPTSFEGTVWNDANRNGQRDENEQLLEGIRLSIHLHKTYEKIDELITDENGMYVFDITPCRDYYLKIYPPVDGWVTFKNRTSDVTLDSDFFPLSKTSEKMWASYGRHEHIDAGLTFRRKNDNMSQADFAKH